MARLINADEAFLVLSDYYHHRTETQADALREALDRVPEVVVRSERIVEIINDLIDNAVHHGADCGGSYESNYEGLIASAQNLLDALKLDERYGIKKLPVWHDGWTDIVVSKKGDA